MADPRTCDHPHLELKFWPDKNGRPRWRRQCNRCWQPASPVHWVSRKDAEREGPLDQIPLFDEQLRQKAWEIFPKKRPQSFTPSSVSNIWGQHCTYRRVHFRSLLEARWAAYFDHLNLEWEYEPTTYALTVGSTEVLYMPDFYLPTLDIHVEVKGAHFEGIEKVGLLVMATRKSVLIGREAGQFALVTYWNDEPSDETDTSDLPIALVSGETDALDLYTEHYSSLSTDEHGHDARFTNWGQTSDVYVGQPPDYFDSMKDRIAPDGSDARSYYWGGRSTWSQRGFMLPRNKIRRVFKPFLS